MSGTYFEAGRSAMRWVLGFLVVAGLATAGGVVWFLTARSATGVTPTSGRDSGARSVPFVAEGGDEQAGGTEALEPSANSVFMDDTALARLEAELKQAEPVEGRSDEERLAEARAWVAGNRPADRPYNELEAKMLALIEVIFDGEERSALWAMNTSLIEVEMVRALDANGDGVVTEDEVKAFSEENITILGALEHPYIKEKLDTNKDGELSQEELAKLEGIANMQGAFAGVLERAQIERWDLDENGELTEGEIEAGQEATMSQVKYFSDGHAELVADASEIDAAEQQAVKDELAEKFGAQVLDVLERQKEMIATQALVQSLMESMRVENMDQNELRAEIMKNFPKPPEQFEFDADGDGAIDETEGAAYAEAAGQYQQKIQEWGSQQAAIALQMEFNHAISQSDSNSDGRMSDPEWDVRMDELLTQRDQRLFLRSYDLDRSGQVDPSELNRFIDWHQAGSLRADANYDGVVDARDLQQVQENYIRQGG